MQQLPQIVVGTITSSNPHLWVDSLTLDQQAPSYRISTAAPGEDWAEVNQFCSLLAIRWLLARAQGTPPSPYGLNNFSNAEKITMAQQLINATGMDAQVTLAVEELGGTSRTLDQTATGVGAGKGSYAVGTRIWAGNARHVMAIYISSATEFLLYDPETGATTTEQRADFTDLMTAFENTAFVVRQ